MRLSSLAILAAFCLSGQSLETVKVQQATAGRTASLPGELTPFQQVALRARVSGMVEKVLVDRGSSVKQGDLLVELSAPEMAAQRAEVEARVLAIEAQRLEVRAKAAAARSTLERLKAASATPGAVANNDIILAEKALEAAEAHSAALQKSADAAASQIATLKQLESYLFIRAPFSGVVTRRLVHPGALASPSSGDLLEIEQVSRLRLTVPVPELYSGSSTLAARASFSVPAFPGESFSGTIARKAPSLDPLSRTLLFEADVDNSSGRLAPGMFATVQWPLRASASVWLVPPTAIATTTEKSFVIRVTNGQAEHVPVTRVHKQGDLQAILGPLKPGDTLLKRATDEVRAGAPIR
jgi:RND family efflux transporter MFP subunit